MGGGVVVGNLDIASKADLSFHGSNNALMLPTCEPNEAINKFGKKYSNSSAYFNE